MRHTIDTMQVELDTARARGDERQVADLLVLIANARGDLSPTGVLELAGARNRQSQRRWALRHGGPSGGGKWRVGDYVLGPPPCTDLFIIRALPMGGADQVLWCKHVDPTKPTYDVKLPPKMARRPHADQLPKPGVPASVTDALYHACWDKLEGGTDDALRAALAAYEAALASLGL